MKWIKRIAIVVISVVLLLLLVNIGLNWWISSRLPGIINRENDSPYQITYKDLDISLLTRNLTATEIIVVPKSSLDSKKQKAGLYGKIKSLEVNGFSVWEIVFSDRIKARSLVVNTPELTLLKTSARAIDNPKSITSEVVKPFSKIVYVSDVFLNNGGIKITDVVSDRRILSVSNINIKLEGIEITDETLARKMPFSFKTYAIDCDSVFYQASEFYHLVTKKIETTEKGLTLNGFKMVPEYNRENFLNRIPIEKDLY